MVQMCHRPAILQGSMMSNAISVNMMSGVTSSFKVAPDVKGLIMKVEKLIFLFIYKQEHLWLIKDGPLQAGVNLGAT